jgi:hypothetical protein
MTSRKYYEANKVKVSAASAARAKTPAGKAWWHAYRRDSTTWIKRTLYYKKYWCKQNGVEFAISAAEIVLPAICPITLLPFDFASDKRGKPRPQSPSLDRLNPNRGYVTGNVRVISLQANVMKSNVTDPEIFLRLYKDALMVSLI